MKVSIKTEFIPLDALLKYADILPSGGVTKILLAEGTVTVNDVQIHERRKKIYPGDIVSINWPSEELAIQLEVEKE